MMGSSPWLKDFFEAALQRPPRHRSLNGCYLQAISSLAPRRHILLFDGRHTVDAVLTASAVKMLDEDEEQMGVTSSNILGYILAPVDAVVVPDMSNTPPTAKLIIKHTRVFSDQQHNRPPGELINIDLDPSVLNALRANVGSKLASFATVSTLEKADRIAQTLPEQDVADEDINGIMQDIANVPSFPPAKLLEDPHTFNVESPPLKNTAPHPQHSSNHPPQPSNAPVEKPSQPDANDTVADPPADVDMSDEDVMPIDIVSAQSAPTPSPVDPAQPLKPQEVQQNPHEQMVDVQSQVESVEKETPVEDDTQHPDWEVSFGQDATMKDPSRPQDEDSDALPQTQHFAVDDEDEESSEAEWAPEATSGTPAQEAPSENPSAAKGDQVQAQQIAPEEERVEPSDANDAGKADSASTAGKDKSDETISKPPVEEADGKGPACADDGEAAPAKEAAEMPVVAEQDTAEGIMGAQTAKDVAEDKENAPGAPAKDVSVQENNEEAEAMKDVISADPVVSICEEDPVQPDTAGDVASGREGDDPPVEKPVEASPSSAEPEITAPASAAVSTETDQDANNNAKVPDSRIQSGKVDTEPDSVEPVKQPQNPQAEDAPQSKSEEGSQQEGDSSDAMMLDDSEEVINKPPSEPPASSGEETKHVSSSVELEKSTQALTPQESPNQTQIEGDALKSTGEDSMKASGPATNGENQKTSSVPKNIVSPAPTPSAEVQEPSDPHENAQSTPSVHSSKLATSPIATPVKSGRKRKVAQYLQNDRIREQQESEAGTPSKSESAMKKLRNELDILRKLRKTFDRDPDGFCLLPDRFIPD